MATTVSRAKLIRKILRNTGSWQTGQDLPQEDYQTVDDELDGELAAMASEDIYVVDIPCESVPIEAYSNVAHYISYQMVSTLGIGDAGEIQRLQSFAVDATRALRYLRRTQPTFQNQQADYF